MPLFGMIYEGPSLYQNTMPLWCDPYIDEVREIVRSARSVAVNILGPRDEYERTHYLTHKYGIDHRVTKIKAHKAAFLHIGSDGGEDGALLAVRWIVGIAGFLLGNVSAPLMGDDFSLRRFALEEYHRVEKEMDRLSDFHQFKYRHKTAKSLTEMLLYEKKVFKTLRRNAEVVLALRVALLVCSTIALTGAILGGMEMLFFGAAGMFLTTSTLLLKTGIDSQGYQMRQLSREVRRHVDYLLGVSWWTGTSSLHYPVPILGMN